MDQKRALFLPIDDRILCLYNGYVQHGKMLNGVTESDVYAEKEFYKYPKAKRIELILLLPLFIILICVAFIMVLLGYLAVGIGYCFKKKKNVEDAVGNILDNSVFKFDPDNFLGFLLFKKKQYYETRRVKNEEYIDAHLENTLPLLQRCKKYNVEVFLYSITNINSIQEEQLKHLIDLGYVKTYVKIEKVAALHQVIKVENICLRNSLIILKGAPKINGVREMDNYFKGVKSLGFWTSTADRVYSYASKYKRFYRFCTLDSISSEIEYYLIAKDKLFLKPEYILFVEDEADPAINEYLENNIDIINSKLAPIGKQLLYFPTLKKMNYGMNNFLFDFFRYRVPGMYSISDEQIELVIQSILAYISPADFYKWILTKLDLPVFKRPALLRNLQPSEYYENDRKFTYCPIDATGSLDAFFDWYIEQIKNYRSGEITAYAHRRPPRDYDADWWFQIESQRDSEELKQLINALKDKGSFGVLAEALLYMIQTIKNEKPEVIKQLKYHIEVEKMLDSKVAFSRIVIDEQNKILLPDYGNVEVKMHALPKTVYLLFLRYPEGIKFKELYLYKKELLEIYTRITNRYDNEEIQRAIDDLVDMTKPSINQKCARIREAFRAIMDEELAVYYYITGLNGEPKKIALSRNLISIKW